MWRYNMGEGRSFFCSHLRVKCLIIGYMNLVACVVDIGFHFLIGAIVSSGFQCDVSNESAVDWPWLQPLLLFVNLGTHGFYPFPLIISSDSFHLEYSPVTQNPKCYPGMIHMSVIDIINFLINVLWLKFVTAYVKAIHKKDPEPMRMFFHLSMVKLVLQIMYFAYQPPFNFTTTLSLKSYWFLKLLDVGVAAFFLFIINSYINQVRREQTPVHVELPPSYFESLNGTEQPSETISEKKEELTNISVISVQAPARIKPEMID